MRLWIWRNLRVELPEDWEMLQFSREAAAGRCAFADRYQSRLELSWRAVPGPPDVARMMSDYLAKLRLDGTMADAAPTDAAAWRGIEGHQGERPVSRFGRHVAEEGCIVEAVFLWPNARDAELERSVLESIAAEPERLGRFRRWRAFGMDVLATSDLRLVECVMQPACAKLLFGDTLGRRQQTFLRAGMVPEWLEGSVKEWLIGQAPKDVVIDTRESGCERGHAIEGIRGVWRPKGLNRLRWRSSRYAAAAWLCPGDGRLYYVVMADGETDTAVQLAGRRLSCCAELELPR